MSNDIEIPKLIFYPKKNIMIQAFKMTLFVIFYYISKTILYVANFFLVLW